MPTADPTDLHRPFLEGVLHQQQSPLSEEGNSHRQPLDAGRLQLLVENVKRQSRETKAELHDQVAHRMDTLNATLFFSRRVKQQVDHLVGRLHTLQKKIEDPDDGLRARLQAPTREYERASEELEIINQVIQILDIAKKVNSCNQLFESSFQNASYLDAARQCLEMRDLAVSLPKSENDIHVYHMIRKRGSDAKITLSDHLTRLWSQAILFKSESDGFVITIHRNVEGTELERIVQALATLDVLPELLNILRSRLVSDFVDSALSGDYNPMQIMQHQNQIRLEMNRKTKESSSTVTYISQSEDIGRFFQDIQTLFQFLLNLNTPSFIKDSTSTSVENVHHEHICRFGSSLWHDICTKVESLIVRHHVPLEREEYSRFKSTLLLSETLLRELVAQNIVTASDEPIPFLVDLDKHFAFNKRQHYLVTVRNILVRKSHDLVLTSLEISRKEHANGIRISPKADLSSQTSSNVNKTVISISVSEILSIGYEICEDAIELQDENSKEILQRSLLEIMELFIAVVPVLHGAEIANLPQLSAVFFNDCVHLSRHLESMISKHAIQITNLLPNSDPLSDRLLLLGNEFLVTQIQNQRRLVLESLSAIAGLSNMSNPKRQEILTRSIRQVIHYMKHLGSVWKDVLAPAVLRRCLGLVTDVILDKLYADILGLEDIAEEACKFMYTQFENLLSTLSDILQIPKYRKLPQNSYAIWDKFRQMTDLLDLGLNEILEHYRDGSLHALPAGDIRQLVTALFSSSTFRERVLQEIR